MPAYGSETMRITSIAAALVLIASGAGAAQAAGDPEAGAKVFLVCKTCHQIGEGAKNSVGPEQNGLIGRKAGSVAGHNYSDANKNSGITWTEENLKKYLHDPKAMVPGTKMVYAGLKDDKKIDDLIAYLKQFGPDGKKQ